jgi:hypothetical protein
MWNYLLTFVLSIEAFLIILISLPIPRSSKSDTVTWLIRSTYPTPTGGGQAAQVWSRVALVLLGLSLVSSMLQLTDAKSNYKSTHFLVEAQRDFYLSLGSLAMFL